MVCITLVCNALRLSLHLYQQPHPQLPPLYLPTHSIAFLYLPTYSITPSLSIPPLPPTHTHTDKHTIASLLLLHFIYNLYTLPTEELLSFYNSDGWILACGLFESVWVEVAAAVHLTHVDFCKIFYGEPPLNWEGGGREEGDELLFWKVKEDLEDLGVTCIWSLDTSAGLPCRHTSVFLLPSRMQDYVWTGVFQSSIGTFLKISTTQALSLRISF